MYRVMESKQAQKALLKMQPVWARRIRRKIAEVAADPYGDHPNVKRLRGSPYYRLRIGDWRALYSLEDDALILLVIDVLPHGSAYKH